MVIPANLSKLGHLVAVAEFGSFSKASQKLSLTQPALSRSVAESERRLGLKIFDRGNPTVTMTIAGATVISEARALLQCARGFERNISLLTRGEMGRVRFAMAPVVASIVLGPMTIAMLRGHPMIDITPLTIAPAQALSDLRADLIDVAILPIDLSGPAESDLEVEPLFDLDVSVLVRSGHPLTRRPVTFADVADYKIVSGELLDTSWMKAGMIVCTNFEIVKQMVMESDLVWFSSPLVAPAEIASGRLANLMKVGERGANFEACLVRKCRMISPAEATFMKELREFSLNLRGSQPAQISARLDAFDP